MKKYTDMPKTNLDQSSVAARRHFLKLSPAVAATCFTLPMIMGEILPAGPARAESSGLVLNPRYYPLDDFQSEIDLSGKLAVITGASRGIGRSTAEVLEKLGVEVIGTSRNVKSVLNPPNYPLLNLDITSQNSVSRFAEALQQRLRRRKIDILINNAGRFVIGPIAPILMKSPSYYMQQLHLATETLYQGHIRVTHALLPMMPNSGYARLLFTVSSGAYLVGGTDVLTPWVQGYLSEKRALLAYVNSLRFSFQQGASNILISTVNPYIIATQGAEHPQPIYLQPVTDTGYTAEPPTSPFNQALGLIRQIQREGLQPSFVGEAYAQLLASANPPANIVVASTQEPYSTQSHSSLIESMIFSENIESGIRFGVG